MCKLKPRKYTKYLVYIRIEKGATLEKSARKVNVFAK